MGMLSQYVQHVLVVGVVVRLEKAKNLGQVVGNQTPRVDFKVGFHLGYVAWIQYITHTLYIYNIFVYLHHGDRDPQHNTQWLDGWLCLLSTRA